MDYLCAKFGDFSFSRFGFIVRSDRQTDRIIERRKQKVIELNEAGHPQQSRADLVFFRGRVLSRSHPVGEFVVQATAPTYQVDRDGCQSDAADQSAQNIHRDEVFLSDATAESFL